MSPILPLMLLMTPLIAGCATDTGRYPSLARRDVERMDVGDVSGTAAEPVLATPAAPPADLPGRLAAIGAAAREAHAEFLAIAPAVRRRAAAASGAAVATDRWSDAQVAIAELESARSETMFALADLDSLLALSTVTEAETGIHAGLPQIATLRQEVAALVAEEDAALRQVSALLR